MGLGEDLTEEFLQQRLHPNKSLPSRRFALPKRPDKRKPSPNLNSPINPDPIIGCTPICDRHKSCMVGFVDDTNIATGSSILTGFFIYVFHFVSLLVGKVKAIFSFATRF